MTPLYGRRAFVRDGVLIAGGLTFLGPYSRLVTRSPIRRIGFFVGVGYSSLEAAFHDELRRIGYVEGKDIVIETRLSGANPGDLPALAAELAHMDLELILAGALPFALAIRKANPAMTMVIATCPGMVSNGFAQSLAHPAGHYTGLDELPPGVTAKRLTLLKTAVPSVARVALLSTTPGVGGHETQLADAEQAAAALGITVRSYRAASVSELHEALVAIATSDVNGLLNFQGGLSLSNRQLIVDFAAEHHLPAIYQATLFAEAGGLMSWAPNLENQYRAAAHYVDKILKGAHAGDLPITYPSDYALTINQSAARGLGVTVSPALLGQADRVLP